MLVLSSNPKATACFNFIRFIVVSPFQKKYTKYITKYYLYCHLLTQSRIQSGKRHDKRAELALCLYGYAICSKVENPCSFRSYLLYEPYPPPRI